MRYFAEIGPGNVVLRVIVADSPEDCIRLAPGCWIETYRGLAAERYAGKGMVYVPSDPRKFLGPNEVE